MSKGLTDSSYFMDKVELRINHLPRKKNLKVLDAFGGEGRIWNKIEKITNKKLSVLRIDKEADKSGAYLKGANIKFMKNLDLSQFDVIDLDAYGTPYDQLEILFRHHRETDTLRAVIFVTFVQNMQGNLHRRLLYQLGYTKNMIDKVPSIFMRRGFEKLKEYLVLNGVVSIHYRGRDRKHYIAFRL